MRIIAGKFKGQTLATPNTQAIRPTSDRLRESLFNILQHTPDFNFENCRVLDLFAGTGALAFEAISRGAQFAFFMENSTQGRAILRANVDALKLGGQIKISKRDATRPGKLEKGAPYNLIFADPPYKKNLGEAALIACSKNGWIEKNALIILEESTTVCPHLNDSFHFIKQNKFATSSLFFYRFI